MIIDTTYLLPLARIRIKHDLLKAIAKNDLKERIDFSNIKVSLISIFELQAKASKLGIPPQHVSRAVNTIFKAFTVVPFYRKDIIKEAHNLRKILNDYIDCIILATAITSGEDLVTEDSLITLIKGTIEKQYGVSILSYEELVRNTE